MEVLQDIGQSIPPIPRCGFDVAPKGPTFTYTVGGVIYPGSNEYFTNTDLTFTGWVDADPSISIVQFHWDFGDGITAVGNPVTHRYIVASPETRVSFCITDNFRRQICRGMLLNLRPGIPIAVGAYIVRG